MGALPKKKQTRGRTNRRRHSPSNRPSLPTLVKCPSCKKLKPPHIVCPHCGFYGKVEKKS